MAERKLAEKKEDARVKTFAVANLNAQRANMRIDLASVDAREGPLGSRIDVPVLTIKGSAFDHIIDLEILGLGEMWDGASPIIKGKYSDKPNEGYTLDRGDGSTVTIRGEESLKILAEAGVEFPAANQFLSPARKMARGGGGPGPVMV